MIKKITQISFAIIMVVLLVSCKNTKQKIQEHVSVYNNTEAHFKDGNITGTRAKGFLSDNKIEIRILTNLPQSDSIKLVYAKTFPDILNEMIKEDRVSKSLIDEGVAFDVYFLANNSTILAQKFIGKEELAVLEKGGDGVIDEKVSAKL
ncbi:hypothetical protein AR687_19585 [Flavobacteriaceae bacterium CRH]|nr:hypothetical protein AR687_19585 [Flavobacteriaceae bacterium CRH]